MIEKVGKVIGKVLQGSDNHIERFTYAPYQMEIALKEVSRIGQGITLRFVIDDDNRFVYENLVRWVQGDKTMMCHDPDQLPGTRKVVQGDLSKGLFICGQTGTGKSVALEVMTEFSTIDNVKLKVDEEIKVLHWACFHVTDVVREWQRRGSIDFYKRRFILALQDVGTEPKEALYMGTRLNTVRDIIEYRGDRNNMLTLITSNYPMNHPATVERYGERVVSRLHQMCNYMELGGKDRRLS